MIFELYSRQKFSGDLGRQKVEVYQKKLVELVNQEPMLRAVQAFKQEAGDLGLEGKYIAQYVTKQQALDRGERADWRDARKIQVEEKCREDEVQI